MRNPILTKIGGNYHQNPKMAKLGTAAKEMIAKVMEGGYTERRIYGLPHAYIGDRDI